ncbi:hypothetical protein BaRGS_00040190 [Batillaria attramentaria]|uniref:Uncharacterized protein n=1 Tax=Batillaria attramentaria TaxID=370345 RepID=A0ABD0J102_9CAEN
MTSAQSSGRLRAPDNPRNRMNNARGQHRISGQLCALGTRPLPRRVNWLSTANAYLDISLLSGRDKTITVMSEWPVSVLQVNEGQSAFQITTYQLI